MSYMYVYKELSPLDLLCFFTFLWHGGIIDLCTLNFGVTMVMYEFFIFCNLRSLMVTTTFTSYKLVWLIETLSYLTKLVKKKRIYNRSSKFSVVWKWIVKERTFQFKSVYKKTNSYEYRCKKHQLFKFFRNFIKFNYLRYFTFSIYWFNLVVCVYVSVTHM